jgi:ABC-2 type transport system permease protein
VVGDLIGLKIATLRHAWRGSQSSLLWTGAVVGVLLAAYTFVNAVGAPDVAAALDWLALAFALWAFGWILLPVVGGSGGDPLRPEHFRLLAIPPRRLAAGLLVAGVIGVLPVVSIVAFGGLVVPALELGPAPFIVAIVAVGLLLALVIVLSRVVVGGLSRAMETRIGLELAALQYALIVGLSFFWVPFIAFGDGGGGGGSGGAGFGAVLVDAARVLPTGWGIVAVDAAGRAEWVVALAALAGQAGLVALLAWAYSAIVANRLELSPGASRSSRGLLARSPLARLERVVVPPTPLGSVVSRELRNWLRQPRRALELRVALWCGFLLAVLPGFIGSTVLWPWAGAIVVVIAGVGLANVYGIDGTSYWLTLLAPGLERTDVRGRQLAWLLLVGAITVLLTIVLTLASAFADTWPWVASALPALLGGAAGLGILLAVVTPAPLPERRGGDPLDLGDDPTTGANLMVHGVLMCLVVPALAVPALLAVAWAGAGPGIAVGLATGIACVWLGGAIATWRLRTAGPEMLERLRARPPAKPSATAASGRSLSRSRSIVRNMLFVAGALLIFPQGIVALILYVVGTTEPLWFLALYVPDPWPIPVAIASISLGVAAWYAAWKMGQRPQPAGRAQERDARGA